MTVLIKGDDSQREKIVVVLVNILTIDAGGREIESEIESERKFNREEKYAYKLSLSIFFQNSMIFDYSQPNSTQKSATSNRYCLMGNHKKILKNFMLKLKANISEKNDKK